MAEEDELYIERISMVSAAEAAEAVGVAIREAGGREATWIEHAVQAHPGMLSAIALSSSLERWSAKMAVLGDRTGGVAGKVRDTLAEVDRQDRSAEESFGGPHVPV
ncbi:MAG: hypothetical protein ACRDRZ_09835 [Pseudonocardiaceae bacterium]